MFLLFSFTCFWLSVWSWSRFRDLRNVPPVETSSGRDKRWHIIWREGKLNLFRALSIGLWWEGKLNLLQGLPTCFLSLLLSNTNTLNGRSNTMCWNVFKSLFLLLEGAFIIPEFFQKDMLKNFRPIKTLQE
jgi:hypothetical protein